LADNSKMNENKEPISVELYLQGGHLTGRTHQVEKRRRLVDVLNGPESVFEIESAMLTLTANGATRVLPSIAVDKTSILAAAPHETHEQVRRRALLNAGISRSLTTTPIGLLMTPLYVEGTAHVAPGAGQARPDLTGFARFFPLTAAVLYLPDGRAVKLPVLLVNRDCVSAISLPSPDARVATRSLASGF
jgi:hypothetical protein